MSAEKPEPEPRFRPRFGRARERVAESSLGVARLVRHGHGRRGSGRARRYTVAKAAPGFAPKLSARRVVIKAHVQYLSRNGAQAARRHLRYIERDGVEKDGSPGVLYGAEGTVSREACEMPRPGERHQFRFIVSPEDGHDLDLTAFTRDLLRQVERDLGQPLEWAAANHYDTDRPHAHVVVRGVDLDGAQVWMQPAYIARGMRWSAQELATERLGPRLEREIQETYEREVPQERMTSLDRELEQRREGLQVDAEAFATRQGYPQPDTLWRRLEQLEHLGLAERVSGSAWALAEGWQEHLRDLGIRGDKLKQMHRAMHGMEPAGFHVVGPGQGIPDGRGGVDERELVVRVARKGLADESKGTYFAVLETAEGRVYHVPLSGPASDKLTVGQLATFAAKRAEGVRPVDRELARVAGEHDGVYELRSGVGRDRKAAEVRLGQLAKLGHATLESPDRWRVAPNLLEELERRQREAPRYRHSLQPAPSLRDQAEKRAPVWLDQVDPETLSLHGLGGDVRVAIARRREVLRGLGIAPDDPAREAKLRDLPRQDLARWVVNKEPHWTFVAETPDRFRGDAAVLPGDRFVGILDAERRFVLIEATPEARALHDREVELRRDTDGRVRLFDERARQELGEKLARETYCAFVRDPTGFQGEVREGPKGSPYLVVRGDRADFTLIPDTPDARARLGQEVRIHRSAGLEPPDRDRPRGLGR